MLVGTFGPGSTPFPGSPDAWKDWGIGDPGQVAHSFQSEEAAFALASSGAPSHDAGHLLFEHPEDGTAIALYGNIFNWRELQQANGLDEDPARRGALLHALYKKQGDKMFANLNGNFVIIVWDPAAERCWVARDHLGIDTLYYHRKDGRLYIGTRLGALAGHPEIQAEMNPTAVVRYMLFNYNAGFDTFFAGINKLRPGSVLKVEKGRMRIEPYWFISFREPFTKDLDTYREELLELFRDSIRLRLDADRFRTGAYLSGGMDSSTIVGLMRPMVDGPIHTLSFRCRGKSYDESEYARLMSERYQTQHHEVPFEAEDVDRISQLAALTNEPFSDIGIEVASFLLAEKASGLVDYVLTGDGGDELFAGHPVYLADRMAEKFDRLPGFVRHPLTAVLQKLPDTEQKKSLMVKAKRFSYSAGFPRDLYSNRWRIYYKENELKSLLQPDWLPEGTFVNAFEDVRQLYGEADGADALSRTLYADYYTVVSFSLSRLELVRHFGLESRVPMLDHRLVEYTARIPSDLKLDRKGKTKAIFHDVMAGVLPDEIVFRKDKLGHSVPFKNWLRDSPHLQRILHDYLAPEVLKKRGVFNTGMVQKMFERHMSRAENNSHRLWAIVVFELWCRNHLDKQATGVPTTREAA